MSVIQVQGLRSLKGEIKIQGSKNAVLPMMAAAVLHKGTTVIHNVPRIQDVFCMLGILEHIGCICTFDGHSLTIDASTVTQAEIPEEYIKSMRSSIMLSGPLLGRTGNAVTSFPGGCSIGERPIDLHLSAFRKLGAVIEEKGDKLVASANRLMGADIYFPFPSVGATENALMAAVYAQGVTVIHGAAKEPEIITLCEFLNNMGAKIHGTGTSRLAVTGVKALWDSEFTVAGDRIVAGTYLMAVMAAEGNIVIQGIRPGHLTAALYLAEKMGAEIKWYESQLEVSMRGRPDCMDVMTEPYPGFPTDLQSQLMAVMASSKGMGRLKETIFEGRFGTAKELRKLGADIIIEEKRAVIRGLYPLKGNRVIATDLRGGAALVVAGLASEGVTEIHECHHIERGYEDICRDLSSLGAAIRGLE
ncbi:UDP-N-acetylglucosamine 1-carboxyvinyltransferase [Lacrimispora saccharolytica]|uniref:UDP-N-acetylglucosamine 1-carboxyvinyltransferase n=1 Tax=Lacrimispora saccharolytica (strain ATCC 35040 / DSM 2544 / NRCC 2533 / WM1) TaxID=610130 RepID=D9R4F8_LACSW|nr:UDP-N-acetylglucosamine 1-carboxyvinyltransferase [Lacrimispora saccharolytica]ADL05028.1 UDP-N-acetylglucosamine 1-carboxyvinyltransferase [[Clostridium] saccharolyticum WM1]QRV20773.1 UDP-N-acetylglucosamine 1-carboxyvinyltransferase [Lacrimispora saccharolytica]